jgi:acetyl esterase/lipase
MIRLLAVALFLLGFAGMTTLAMAPAQLPAQKVQPKPPALPTGVDAHRDLTYGPHPERNTLDLFVPKSGVPLPLVIWVHGGAWSAGSKTGNNPAMALLTKGYAVAAINYRLSQHAVFPTQIHDCKSAVRFLRENAKKYNLNPDAFGVWGSSAGGHLVALLGTSGGNPSLDPTPGKGTVSDRVQAVCDFFGPTDLTKMGEQSGPNSKIDHNAPNSPESRLIGGPIQENKEKAAKANPIGYVSKDSPPFLIVHGDSDPLVPLGQSELLVTALKKSGVEVELIVIKGGGHGGPGFASPENQAKINGFFDRHLKLMKAK